MNDFVIKRRFKLTGPLFAAVILLGGCGSLPDLKGFAEATGDREAESPQETTGIKAAARL